MDTTYNLDADLSGEERVFHDSYDRTLLYLENRQKMAPVSLIVLEGELHHLTVYEGQDWVGRGELKNSEIQGQIYAYIAFIGKMKEELQNE
ncbi:MAG: hypothetical protein AB7S66_10955 [Sphaerochaeta sp.]|jgi:hypothetical protein|uniref:Uncharacterized protein n=1 Tax=Sphaerochaeta halotolerans TaxID=2293840 RepID=A0A372MHJ9_9SPIR|nr:hypothetical protein [Sphaerochaeta halotolerans]MBG0768217.1 hypothetical protein [Spirochaetaceae bacterium]MDK2860588.1 hypothetical protein [Sphaerochaeta sp.]RFU94933.1 hypothetical protein DYP60_06840 [Sphaerochaeta halotolerans]